VLLLKFFSRKFAYKSDKLDGFKLSVMLKLSAASSLTNCTKRDKLDSRQDNRKLSFQILKYLERVCIVCIWLPQSWRSRRCSATFPPEFSGVPRSTCSTDRARRSLPGPADHHQQRNRESATNRLCVSTHCTRVPLYAILVTIMRRLLSRRPRTMYISSAKIRQKSQLRVRYPVSRVIFYILHRVLLLH